MVQNRISPASLLPILSTPVDGVLLQVVVVLGVVEDGVERLLMILR